MTSGAIAKRIVLCRGCCSRPHLTGSGHWSVSANDVIRGRSWLRRSRNHGAYAPSRQPPRSLDDRNEHRRPLGHTWVAVPRSFWEFTTYPGTTEELVAPLLETASGLQRGVDFYLGYSPETHRPRNSVWTLVNTPKVVSGIDEASAAKVQEFYDLLVERTVVVSSCRVAELTKLLENTFRHVNIALVNELAVFAHDLGINVWEAIDAASSKPFGYMRFTPGPGVGGHCLPVDPSYLSWQVRRTLGRSFRFIELANDINDHMPDYVVGRATALLDN